MRNNIYILLSAMLLMLMASCINDLDVKPIDPDDKTSEDIYETTQDYKEGLAKLYASIALSGQQGPAGNPDIKGIDEGFSNYLRQYWNCQELTTDEAIMAWNDATIKDFHWHTWAPNDVFITAMYSRIMYTVSISNEYIRATEDKKDDPEISIFRAEARFLRALVYYHGLDLFGKMSFVTEKDTPGSFFPPQISRSELFNYIEKELLEIEGQMGEPKFEFGRADKGAAWILLSKLYLNAPVYIGQDKNTEALTFLNKLISANYSLAPGYLQNTTADNNTSPEIILSINSDGNYTRTYGGMTYLVHASIGGSMPANDMFGVGSGWGGIRSTSALVTKFGDLASNKDERALFWTDGQKLEINDVGQFTEGYGITKFRNKNFDGSPAAHAHNDFVDTDYPMFRLADAYLMYAEAVLRGGSGGDMGKALELVNEIRKRAKASTISSSELTLDFILDERSRELYWEGHRRTDLIRFKKFTGGSYLWPWKGKVVAGAATDAHRDLFPIPAGDMATNPNLKQNDGY